MNRTKTYYIVWMLIPFFVLSCTEPFNLKSIDFEDALIIEAIITDEVKYQEIKLSRTFSLEEFTPSAESNAEVTITDNSQNIYKFEESSSGTYTSTTQFGASANEDYILSVTTKNGKSYKSNPTQLPDVVPINNLYASRKVSEDTGNENMSIVIDGFDPLSISKYFRYEYEETYEIIAPAWIYACIPSDLPPPPPEVCAESLEMKTCYNTITSDSIIQINTSTFKDNIPSAFEIRKISRNNPIIRTRYSILVKQYAQSLEAFTFYKVLNKFSSSDNVFSQNQPGFFSGNLYAIDDQNEQVVGYFDISSVSSKRIFFNFSDFFPNEELPPYFVDCNSFVIDDINVFNEKIESGEVVPFGDPLPGELQAIINTACVDCRILGTSTKPQFWID